MASGNNLNISIDKFADLPSENTQNEAVLTSNTPIIVIYECKVTYLRPLSTILQIKKLRQRIPLIREMNTRIMRKNFHNWLFRIFVLGNFWSWFN